MLEGGTRLFHSIVTVGLSLTAGCGGIATGSAVDASVSTDGESGDGHARDGSGDRSAPHRADGGHHADSGLVLGRDTGAGDVAVSAEASMCTCTFVEAGCAPRACPNPTGFSCNDAGCCFPCYI
jgi:hypothetical protein